MELRQLKYFEAVARTLNFSRAAEELFIAQPPLSRQIQKLEEEIGLPLLDRSSRPMRLTRAGAYLYKQASQILSRLEEIKATTQRIGKENRKRLGIGFVPSILYGKIPRIIQAFTQEFQDVEIVMTELVSSQQEAALKSGKIDLGFGRLAIESDGLTNTVLANEQLIAAVSAAHPKAGKPSLCMTELVKEVLVLYPSTPRPNYADQIIRQFKIRGLELNETFETNGLQTAIGMAAAGVGIAIVPKSVELLQRPDITYIAINEKGLTSPLLVTTRDTDNSEQSTLFLEKVSHAFNCE